MKTYERLRGDLIAKAEELQGDWTAEDVGRAIWTFVTLSSHGIDPFVKLNAARSNSENYSSLESENKARNRTDREDLRVESDTKKRKRGSK
jgi:hypothetical protein